MLKIDGVRLNIKEDESVLKEKTEKLLGHKLSSLFVYKRAIDARKKSDISFVYSVVADVQNEEKYIKNGISIFKDETFTYPELLKKAERPIVIGTGPAGSFAALTLAKAGARPIIIERGRKVCERKKDTDIFFSGGALNENSNVQFGEGGAGTFSDGKLNTGTHSPYIRKILSEYVNFGAPSSILTDAKPHIGTDILITVAENMRKEIERLGGTYIFEQKVKSIEIKNGKIKAVVTDEEIETDNVILAIGHSARDTFSMLFEKGVQMEQKPFSVGVRIEHPQSLINKIQYGEFENHKKLPPADYKFWGDCYSFCMCPGGYVVAAASEEGGIVTNGMSYSARDGINANSALLINVDSKDFGEELFAGVEFQRKIEKSAYNLTKSYKAPAQTLGDFLKGKETKVFGEVSPTYEPGVVPSNLKYCLPENVCNKLVSGINMADRKLKGFMLSDAVITAPETRSSSPVRILRDKETLQSVSVEGLYPCGEGAGYAGGIMSAAADGIRCAVKLIEKLNNA